MKIAEFMVEVQRIYATGQATEHSYRAVLGDLFDSIDRGNIVSINEPKAVTSGRPDFVFLRNLNGGDQVTAGHCEAKDIGLDISKRGLKDSNKNQWERYTKALPNLIYTNCLDWHFYKNGELIREIKIADYLMGIQPLPENFDALTNQLKDFAAERLQTVTSAQKLAEMMAGKAVLTKDILFNTLREDEDLTSELAGQFKAFKDQLIHDLEIGEFSDIYAETIAYGMFAARLHDESLSTFSREEALNLLPKSNPFLRNLFSFVAGPNLDDSLRRTIDELAEIFQATDLQKLFENFGSFTQRNDPFIHFYETFLAEYNPKKRKARGVWYTPEPVVNFIVRAVDDVLKEEFGLKDGLADTSKVTVNWDTGFEKKGKPIIEKREVHRVQILDPAAGTGTFLAEVIKQIAPRIKKVGGSVWNRYVENELIPRLHGFELLMASYAMCHMKLDMMLSEMDYRPTKDAPRFNVYLTNSLEEGEREPKDLFMARWLSDEAQAASEVKRNTPIMCVIGNPPYSGESANKGDWIMDLMDAYKKEPGGKEKLKERNPKWINDDYVKFIRFAEHMIEKTGEGVMGFITNHGYLDNPTFRGMRWHLLKTFDKIWVLDLHGNSKKKEVSPDGSPDNNVFDIQQGVAIVIAVKRQGKAKDKPLAQVMHGDLWGARKEKYAALGSTNRAKLALSKLPNQSPHYPMIQRDFSLELKYESGFNISTIFGLGTLGFQTHRDGFAIAFDRLDIIDRIADLNDYTITDSTIARKYSIKDNRDWQISKARDRVRQIGVENVLIVDCDYRPFDQRPCILDSIAMDYPRPDFNSHILAKNNLCLIVPRQISFIGYRHSFVSQIIAESCLISNKTKEGNVNFPLYLYPDDSSAQSDALAPTERTVNMDPEIRRRIVEAAMGNNLPLEGRSKPAQQGSGGGVAVNFKSSSSADDSLPPPETGTPVSTTLQGGGKDSIPEPSRGADGRPNEVAIFDYIYGVLHCPAYRETYAEFLKIDFPRIPYPESPEIFADISAKGTQLRKLHLMEDEAVGDTPYPFEGEGKNGEDNVVEKPVFEDGNVNINDGQYFASVPEMAWNFYIGGYQPAQKWLKDRRGRELSFDDIRHYQKIIKILSETDRIMKTIHMDFSKE